MYSKGYIDRTAEQKPYIVNWSSAQTSLTRWINVSTSMQDMKQRLHHSFLCLKMISVFYGVVCSVVALMSFLPTGTTNPCSAFRNYCKVSTHQAVDAASQQSTTKQTFHHRANVLVLSVRSLFKTHLLFGTPNVSNCMHPLPTNMSSFAFALT